MENYLSSFLVSLMSLSRFRSETVQKKIDKVDNLKAQAVLDSIEYNF